MEVLQTPTFKKQVKKLHANQKKALDHAILTIIKEPEIGVLKKGDLVGVQVYKFHINDLLVLLAYEFNEYKQQIILLAFGSHENFYRGLKR